MIKINCIKVSFDTFFQLFQECVRDSKKRRTDRVNHSFWSSKQLTDSSSIEKWLMARKKIGMYNRSQRSVITNDTNNFIDQNDQLTNRWR